MIHIETKGPIDEKYAKWRKKAELARNSLVAEWNTTHQMPELNQKIWKELKDIFLNDIFHQKCAYCEGNISAHVTLDVEHYRPKKQVTEMRACIEHIGYFWLAYEWYNLLLACRNCNSAHSAQSGKSHPGKSTEFTVRGSRVLHPADNPADWLTELESEQPILLNPYFDYPEDHIAFTENGFAYAKDGSERGKETIRVCDLNRPALVETRCEVARNKVKTRIMEKLFRQINACEFDVSEAFSAWLNQCLINELTEMIKGSPLQK